MDIEKYTKNEATEQLVLLELHCKRFGEDPFFCVECISKHLSGLSGLSKECIGSCKLGAEVWADLKEWAEKSKEMLDKMDERLAEKLASEARAFRKRLDESKGMKEETGHGGTHGGENPGPGSPPGNDLLLHAVPSSEGSPGIVIDEETAKSTQCTGYKLTAGGELVFSPGVIGGLDQEQKARFCMLGIDWKESAPLKERLSKFKEAVAAAKKRYKGEGITRWLQLTGEEFRKRGIRL